MTCCGDQQEAQAPMTSTHNVPASMALVTYTPQGTESAADELRRVRGKSNANYGHRKPGDVMRVFKHDQEAESERFPIYEEPVAAPASEAGDDSGTRVPGEEGEE